jgi:hypothetical protein
MQNINAWGSRLSTVKGRNLLQVIQQNNLSYLLTGEPIYVNKFREILEFAITNGLSDFHTTIESNLDPESDHSAVTITISTNIIQKETSPRLCNRPTNRVQVRTYINENICLNIRPKKKKTRIRRSCRIYDKINPRGCNDIYTTNKTPSPRVVQHTATYQGIGL